jgi:hypothetical protein
LFIAQQAVVDVSYATDHGRGHADDFLHFVIGRATEGVPATRARRGSAAGEGCSPRRPASPIMSAA